jgi:hypothetical protein
MPVGQETSLPFPGTHVLSNIVTAAATAAAFSIPMQELTSMLEYLGVSKRICLYLARISPQQTIDHLVYEISLQLHEEEGASGSSSSGSGVAAAAGGGQLGQAVAAAVLPLQFADVLAFDAAGMDSCRLRPLCLCVLLLECD